MVIDTLQKVRTADPNNGAYASDYQDMSALKFLADRRGIGLLLVHHLRKQGASDPFQQISGSNGLMGAADTIWLLQRQRMSDTARLLVTGRDMDSCTLHLQTRDCIWLAAVGGGNRRGAGPEGRSGLPVAGGGLCPARRQLDRHRHRTADRREHH